MTNSPFQFVACTLLGSLLAFSTARADDSTSQEKQSNQDQAKAADQWIQELSTKVQLDNDQKDQLREKLTEHSQKIKEKWQKFSEANAQAIALEATMLAAMEESMSDQQKDQFRQQRKSRMEQQAGKKQDANSSSNSGSRSATENDSSSTSASTERSNQQESEQASANSDNSSRNVQNSDASNRGQASNSSEQSQRDPTYFYVTEMIIVPAKQTAQELGMDDKKQQQCDQACQEFHSKLHQAWRDVTRYRNELVQLEAEKLQSVEEVLTDDQLKKMRSSSKS